MIRQRTRLVSAWFALVPMLLWAAEPVDYLHEIKPVLKERCFGCHAAVKQEGGLRLDTAKLIHTGGDSGSAIVAGSPEASPLILRLTAKDAAERMPPEGEPLKPEQIAAIRDWIQQGAKFSAEETPQEDPRKHWSYQRPMKPSVPAAKNDSTHPIDAFIDQPLAAQTLKRQSPADRTTLIRRMFLDVTGLPPTPERVQTFVENRDSDAVSALIEELLASPRYGERWAQHWLDVVRYADTHGFEVNTPRDNAWPYRDYVIRSFNEDKPYDQFVRDQIAGDAFQADEATGFLVASAVLLPGQIGADEESKRAARQDALDEIIVGTTSTILGITLGCARCHDHKFDPLTQRDYYAMQGFFAGVEYGDRPIKDASFSVRAEQAKALAPRIAELQDRLRQYEPTAFAGRTLIIDELDPQRATFLKPTNGPGQNPVGSQRGYKDDVGDANRVGNLSGGQYHWWNNVPGEDVMTYQPGLTGRYQLWISWGAHGSGVHTRDARYVFDTDGDLTTKDDQRELARIDQYYLAGINTGETEQRPLWSGLQSLGILEWPPTSKLILRGGDTGTGITADVIVLQEVLSGEQRPMPQLREPVNAKENVERFAPIEAKFVRFTTLETINRNQHEPCLDELEIYGPAAVTQNLSLASAGTIPTSSGNYGGGSSGPHQLKHINDGEYGNGKSWISDQQGGGWVQLELPQVATIDRLVWGRDRQEKFKDRLPVRYEITVSPDGMNWQRVAGHDDRVPLNAPGDPIQTLLRNQPPGTSNDIAGMVAELDRIQREKTKLETPQMAFAGIFRQPDTTFVLRRGDAEQRIGEIGPAVPGIFQQGDDFQKLGDQERRLELAKWLASPQNPLTARVMVNRLWQGHFGRGLVETPNDFGVNGVKPTHPELLDWLACEFMEHGWSIKHIHRLILSSQTYQQAATWNTTAAEIDRDNRLLWRYPTRRLEGEAIRDTILATTGELNLEQTGGPGFNFFQTRGGLNGFPAIEKFTPNEMRRMIYQHKVRMEPVPVFGAFDCPDAGQSMPKRSRSTTAIQALNLFNSPFLLDRAEKFAERVGKEASSSADQVHRAFQLALGRTPSAAEQMAAFEIVEKHGLPSLCRVLFNSNEYLFLP